MSKSRLALLKAVSISRLELLGAFIGLRLTRQVCSTLKISTNGVTYWVDSINVGYRIQGQSREYKSFIAHRVGEIHEFSAPIQWRYVPTDVNPADLGTRGVTVEELAQADLWWNGPEFLKKSKQDWPECNFDKPTSTENLELKGTKETGTKDAISYQIIEEGEGAARVEEVWRLGPSRFSKSYRVKTKGELEIRLSLVRVTVWVRRFTDNCRKSDEQREKGELKPLEIQNAEEFIIWEVQSKVYAAEIEELRRNKEIPRGSTLAPFNPVLVNGIMRSNTRLRHADDLAYDVKCPIILPKRNRVKGLIVKYHHELEGHQMGLTYRINHVREKYLVVLVREQVKRVMRECSECARRFRSKPASQQMAPLPKIKLQQSSRPFESCAVDFGGPFLT